MFGILCPKLSGDDGVGAERHGKPLQYSFAPFHAAFLFQVDLFSRQGRERERERTASSHVLARCHHNTPHHALLSSQFQPWTFKPAIDLSCITLIA